MPKINKINVKGVDYDVEDATKLDASKTAVANVGGLVIPSQAPTTQKVVTIETDGSQGLEDMPTGTNVVANPTLSGTESDLTGLQVGTTKYKIPSGGGGGGTQLYRHVLTSGTPPIFTQMIEYISNSATPCTNFFMIEHSIVFKITSAQSNLPIILPSLISYNFDWSNNKIVAIQIENGELKTTSVLDEFEGGYTDTVTPL